MAEAFSSDRERRIDKSKLGKVEKLGWNGKGCRGFLVLPGAYQLHL